jgi:glycosyltransferase involved in cell wall biosynthesis
VGDGAELIESSNPDALDRAFRKLIENPQARAELAERGSRRAATWPNEEAAAASLWHLYAELAKGTG